MPADVTVPWDSPSRSASPGQNPLLRFLCLQFPRSLSRAPAAYLPTAGTEADVLRQASEQADKARKSGKPGDLQHTELLWNSSKWKPGNEETNASGFTPASQQAAEAAKLAEEEKELKQKQADEALEQERKRAEEANQQELKQVEEVKE